MRNINTSGPVSFIWDHLFWAAIAFFAYRALCFCPIFGLSHSQSLFILAVTVLVAISVGAIITIHRRRNGFSVFINVTSAYALYFAVSFWGAFPKAIAITLMLAAVLAVCYVALVLFCYIRERPAGISAQTCFCAAMLSARALAVSAFAILLFTAGFKLALGFPLMEIKAAVPSAAPTQSEEAGETIAKNIDTVLLLQEDLWAELDAAQRLDVMKTIADIEANYLGIPEVSVCTGALGSSTLGSYSDEQRTIILNQSHLLTADAHTMLGTVVHEAYHAYQHRLVDLYDSLSAAEQELYLFSDASRYKEEFGNYIDGTEDYEAYASQACEKDSNAYAKTAVLDYYYRIHQYIEECSE